MRYNAFFSLIFVLIQIDLLSQENTSRKYCDSSGCIGDVKYSILEPKTFLVVNGNGWRLMNGDSINETLLAQLDGSTSLPDSRGMFLRGMNGGRNDGNQNPENRKVGEPQHDALKEHAHSFGLKRVPVSPGGVNVSNVEGNEPDGFSFTHIKYTDKAIREPVTPSNKPNTNNYTESKPTEILTSSETRPRNISLFIYVKVDLNTK